VGPGLDHPGGLHRPPEGVHPDAGSGPGALTAADDRRQQVHRDLLFAIARALESLLARLAEEDEAAREWIALEEEITARDRQRNLGCLVILGAVLFMIAFMIVMAILAALR